MPDGHGTTIVFGTSGFAANLLSIDSFVATRESVEDTHMGTNDAMDFLPAALYSWEMDITIEHDAALSVPIAAVKETITVDWAASGNTWAGTGHVVDYSAGAAIGERMEASMKIKGSGTITGI